MAVFKKENHSCNFAVINQPFQKAWDSLQWNVLKNCVSDHRGTFTSIQNGCETWGIKPIKHEYDPGNPSH